MVITMWQNGRSKLFHKMAVLEISPNSKTNIYVGDISSQVAGRNLILW